MPASHTPRRARPVLAVTGALVLVISGTAATLAPQASAADEPPKDYLISPRIIGSGCPAGEGSLHVVDFTGLGINDVRLGCARTPVTDGTSGIDALKDAGYSVEIQGSGAQAKICKINGRPETGCAAGSWTLTTAVDRADEAAAWMADAEDVTRSRPRTALKGSAFGYTWSATGAKAAAPRQTPHAAATHTRVEGQHCRWHEGIAVAIDWGGVGAPEKKVELLCVTLADGVIANKRESLKAVFPYDLLTGAGTHRVTTQEVPASFNPGMPMFWPEIHPDLPPYPARWICEIDGLPKNGCAEGKGHWEPTSLGMTPSGDAWVPFPRRMSPAAEAASITADQDWKLRGESGTVGLRWVSNEGLNFADRRRPLTPPRIDAAEALAWRPRSPEVDTGKPAETPVPDPTPTAPTTTPGSPTTSPGPSTPGPSTPGPNTPGPGTPDPVTPSPGSPAPAAPLSQARGHAASWMARELRQAKPAYQLPRPAGDATDWGLTADAVLGLSATGGYPQTVTRAVEAVDAGAAPYVSYGDRQVNASGAAKMLTVAAVGKKDPHAFIAKPGGGRFDLVELVSSRLGADGGPRGALMEGRNRFANAFGQAYAVIGLSRVTESRPGGAGRVAPHAAGTQNQAVADATAFLITQQCPAGNVQLMQTAQGCTAATPLDIDTTAIAAQAFYAARKAGVPGADQAYRHAVAWLKAQQKPSGAFIGSPDFTPTENGNSTGLAAVVLRTAGLSAEADRAGAWVTTVQARCTTPGLGRELGAVAYNGESFAAGQSEGAGTSSSQRDQWRRTTAQAMLALAPTPFADLTAGSGADAPLASCDAIVPPRPGGGSPGAPGGPGGAGSPGGTGGQGPDAGPPAGAAPDLLGPGAGPAAPGPSAADGGYPPLAVTGATAALTAGAALSLLMAGLVLLRVRGRNRG